VFHGVSPMPWPIVDPAHEPIIAEIQKQRDRAAAIVAVAFVEHNLVLAITMALRDEPKIAGKMLKGSGPLATLSAKIDIGFLLNLYPAAVHRELHTLRDIRNKFAHNVQPVTFKSEGVAALCKNLNPPAPGKRLRMSDEQWNALQNSDFNSWLRAWVKTFATGKDNPRTRFMIAVKINYMRLAVTMESMRRKKRKAAEQPPLPNR